MSHSSRMREWCPLLKDPSWRPSTLSSLNHIENLRIFLTTGYNVLYLSVSTVLSRRPYSCILTLLNPTTLLNELFLLIGGRLIQEILRTFSEVQGLFIPYVSTLPCSLWLFELSPRWYIRYWLLVSDIICRPYG